MELWERDGVKPEDDCSSIVLVRVYADEQIGLLEALQGYVFVIEPSRPDPKYKAPGGHRKPGEEPDMTALRELEGETGLQCRPQSLHYQHSEWKRDHWSVLFVADVELSGLRLMNTYHHENEGEVPEYLTCEAFRTARERGSILRPHQKRLEMLNLI